MSQSLVFLLFPEEGFENALRVAPVITVITAFPICVFVWNLYRKNQQLAEMLHRVVNRDRLTDVATRDFFFAQMEKRPEAYGISLMVDIDHFKKINDTYGHLTGDAVISAVASVLRRIIRAEDIVCRFGGEEFVIFLDAEDRGGGFRVAERMRAEIEALTVYAGGEAVNVTVSIGGSLKERFAEVTQAIREADLALYKAKNAGRNRTVFSGSGATKAA